MKCVSHINREAIRGCRVCGSLICQECATNYDNKCISCEKEELKKIQRRADQTIIAAIPGLLFGVFVVVLAYFTSGIFDFWGQLLTSVIFIILSTGAYFGWQRLDSLSQESFLLMFFFLPAIGWVVYFIVKGALALAIGWIFGALELDKAFRALKYVKKQEGLLAEK